MIGEADHSFLSRMGSGFIRCVEWICADFTDDFIDFKDIYRVRAADTFSLRIL